MKQKTRLDLSNRKKYSIDWEEDRHGKCNVVTPRSYLTSDDFFYDLLNVDFLLLEIFTLKRES